MDDGGDAVEKAVLGSLDGTEDGGEGGLMVADVEGEASGNVDLFAGNLVWLFGEGGMGVEFFLLLCI